MDPLDLKDRIKELVAGEGDLLEKALLGGKELIDYASTTARSTLSGAKVEITITFPPIPPS